MTHLSGSGNTAQRIHRIQHIHYALLLAALVVFPVLAADYGNSWVRIMDIALLYVMMALGLNIVVGFAGLLDLGYIAFYAHATLAGPEAMRR